MLHCSLCSKLEQCGRGLNSEYVQLATTSHANMQSRFALAGYCTSSLISTKSGFAALLPLSIGTQPRLIPELRQQGAPHQDGDHGKTAVLDLLDLQLLKDLWVVGQAQWVERAARVQVVQAVEDAAVELADAGRVACRAAAIPPAAWRTACGLRTSQLQQTFNRTLGDIHLRGGLRHK